MPLPARILLPLAVLVPTLLAQPSPPTSPLPAESAEATAPAAAAAAKKAKAKAKKAAPLTKIPVEVRDRIIVQRGFVPFGSGKRLYAVSVGTPAGVHFAYDLETSAILRVWRGSFLDVGEMWEGRSANQWAKPMGPAVTLHALPLIITADLTATSAWPAQPDDSSSTQGYVLEPDGQPTFLSQFGALAIRDRIAPQPENRGLTRTLTFSGLAPEKSTLLLLAAAKTITAQPDGHRYLIGENEYTVDLPAAATLRPVIQTRGDQQVLVVPVNATALAQPLVYHLAW